MHNICFPQYTIVFFFLSIVTSFVSLLCNLYGSRWAIAMYFTRRNYRVQNWTWIHTNTVHCTRLKRVEDIVLTVPDGRLNSQLGFCLCQHGFLSSSSGWRFNSKEQIKQVLRALYLSALVASNFRKCYIRMVKLMLIVTYELYQNSLQNVNFKSLIYSSVFFWTVVSPPPQKKIEKPTKTKYLKPSTLILFYYWLSCWLIRHQY